MSRLFISHSSKNNDIAIALCDWLVREGWGGVDDIFLDLDPERGIAAGQRWAEALEQAATRCEVVLFLISREWLQSKWCGYEYQLASRLNKKLFALILDDSALDDLPDGLTAQWQVVRLKGEPSRRFVVTDPVTNVTAPVDVSEAALSSLRRGLEKAGVGAQTFELQPDPNEPLGWRAAYRGLQALEAEDAAVFFGRNADIVRGIDALRGLAERHPPRLFVVLGASGAGKSSYLRAGLWPRLLRDDAQWIPLKVVRAGGDGAIEGNEGLLAALEDIHRRFALPIDRRALRRQVESSAAFVDLLKQLRAAAARRAHIDQPPHPMPVICLDQGEEFFAANSGAQSEALLGLARYAIIQGEALLLITIRSDAFGQMQGSASFADINPVALSLGPVPSAEIGQVIRGPSEALRRKAGPQASMFDAVVVARLQDEIAGETDALPLLAFALQRLTLEYAGMPTIGAEELTRTGGVAAAIEAAAEAALRDAGIAEERIAQREVLRRLFIPHLARIDRESKHAQRRVAPLHELPQDLAALARALTERRLLVIKYIAGPDAPAAHAHATFEVAHEALLRRWPMLAELLQEDRDSLLLLDGVLSASHDWKRAEGDRKSDFLAHRGSRLLDGQALVSRGDDWARAVAPAQAYLAACAQKEAAEKQEREQALARRLTLQRRFSIAAAVAAIVLALIGVYAFYLKTQADQALVSSETNLHAARVNQGRFLAQKSNLALKDSHVPAAILIALEANPSVDNTVPYVPEAASALVTSLGENRELHDLFHRYRVVNAVFSRDARRVVTGAADGTRVWDASTGRQLALFESPNKVNVQIMSLSPDGHFVVAASDDNKARIIDVTNGRAVATLVHGAAINSVRFNANGDRIVTASDDMTARVWQTATGQEVAGFRHDRRVFGASFSPDGSHIVSTADDNLARIWIISESAPIAQLAHDNTVKSASYNADGSRLITASVDGTARIWNAQTGEQLLSLKHAGIVHSASFSSDGKYALTTSGNSAYLWLMPIGRQLQRYDHDENVSDARFSADNDRIVTRTVNAATLWSRSGSKLAIFRDESGIDDVAFSQDGDSVVTASHVAARIWDAIGKQAMLLDNGGRLVRDASFSSDGRRIVSVSHDAASVWDAVSGRMLATLNRDHMSRAVLSRDGNRVVTLHDSKAVLWNVSDGATIAELGHDGEITAVSFSLDGSRIVTASKDKSARIWDSATGAQVARLAHNDVVTVASFSSQGDRVVTASDDGAVRQWNAATGAQLLQVRYDYNPVHSTALSPDGRRLLTSSVDKAARVWDATTGAQLMTFQHSGYVNWAAFNPEASLIVTASDDRNAIVWDAETGKKLATLIHAAAVERASFNSDSRYVLTMSGDVARVWDARTGRQLGLFKHGKELTAAAFSPAGDRILTASYDGTVRLWDFPKSSEALVQAARKEAPYCLSAAQRQAYFLAPEIPLWCFELSKGNLNPPRFGILMFEDHDEKLTPASGWGYAVRVTRVFAGLPAASAGFKVGDIIRSVNGKSVDYLDATQRELGAVRLGQDATVAVERDGKQIELKMQPRF